MKRMFANCSGGLATLFLFVVCFGAVPHAAAVDRVTRQGGQVLLFKNGTGEAITNTIALTPDIQVMTNGTFTVKDGKARTLAEGQTLAADGFLTSPDGSVTPVEDHLAMKAGRVFRVTDGEPSPVTATVRLPNGTQATPDGWVRAANGRSTRLLDGQWFKLDGSSIPSRDTITLKDGKVVVQKDGSPLTVPPGRSIMMNDGTKVYGDGRVVKFDGTEFKLEEGKIVTVEGVVRRYR